MSKAIMSCIDTRLGFIGRGLAALVLMLLFSAAGVAQSPPTIVKAFSAATVGLNQSVTLTFTITNPNGATDLTGVGFNDNLPSGLIIANPDSLTGTCDPGVITPSATNINLVGATILAGSSCTFSIDVLATATGDQVNTTDPVTSNEGGTGGTATATVTVVTPDLTIALSHTGNFLRPQSGATYTITVSNTGTVDTTALITVNDNLPAGLTATDLSGLNWNCTLSPLQCTRGDVLLAGTSFEPITVTVNVANNAAASVTNTASVSGGGETNTANDTASDLTQIDPALVLAAQTGSATVTAGGTASTVLNVTANGGSLGAITFACSGLPASATCSFNPPSVTATSQVTMSIATTAKSTTFLPPGPVSGSPIYLAALFGLAGFAVMLLGMTRRKSLRIRLAAGFACLALLAVEGCSVNRSTPSLHSPGTPTGTFAVIVTANSANGGATASSTVNLTVQ
jgi:uncharacterized repeat protein (TIGR01451 family)